MTVKITTLRVSADLNPSGYEAGARRKVEADRQMVESGKKAGEAATATERQVVRGAAGFERLARSIDPAYRAQRSLEAGTRTLNRALETGRISSEQHAALMDRLRQKWTQVSGAANENTKALTQHSNASRLAAGSMGTFERAIGMLPGPLAGLAGALGPIGIAFAALGVAATAAAGPIIAAGDRMVQAMGRLNAATGDMRAAAAVYEDLYRVARLTGTSVEDSAGQFVRFSIAARQIGATRDEVVRLVETVQKFGIISGASTQEAAAGAMQLSQALASGTLQGDELRSILENMPLLAEALANELGVSIGQLRQMGADGELTAERVFGALLRAAGVADEAFGRLPLTVERASGRMATAWERFKAEIDDSLGLSRTLAEVLDAIADKLDSVTAGMSDAPAAVAGRLRKEREALAAELEALGNEADIFRADPSKMLAPGMSGTRIADTEAQIKATQQRREELSRLIAALDHQIFREAELASMQALGEMQAGERAKAEAEVTAAREALGKVTDDLATKEEKARAALAARMQTLDDARSKGLLSEAEYISLAAKAQAEYADATKVATEKKQKQVDTEAEFASVLYEVQQQLDKYQTAVDASVEKLELEAEVLRLQIAGREEQAAWLQEEARLRQQLGPLYDKNAAQLRTLWEQNRRLNSTLKDQREATKRAEQEWQRYGQEISRVAEDIAGDWAESIYNGLTGNGDDIVSWFRSLFKRIAIEALKAQIVLPITTQIVGAVPGLFGISTPASTMAAGSSALSNLNGVSSLFSAGNGSLMPGVDAWAMRTLGWGQIAAPLNAGQVAQGAAALGTGSLEMASGAMRLPAAPGLWNGGSATAGFSSLSNVLGIGGAILPGLLSGNIAQAGLGGAGAALGTAILPGIGTALGGLVGNLVGSLLGGKKNPHPAYHASIGAVDGQFGTINYSQKHLSDDIPKQLGDALSEAANAAMRMILGDQARVTGQGGAMGHGYALAYDQKKNVYRVADASGTLAEFQDQAQAVADLVFRSLKGASYEGIAEDVSTALRNSIATDLDGLAADVAFALGRDTMFDLQRVIGPFEQAWGELGAAMAAAKAKAEELGLGIEAMTASFEGAQERLKQATELDVRQRIWNLQGNSAGAFLALANEVSVLRSDLAAVGGDVSLADEYERLALNDLLVKSRQEEIAAIQTQIREQTSLVSTWERLRDSLRRTRESLLIDPSLSPLSPWERLQEAQRQFDDIARRAQLGDTSAMEQLDAISRSYLEVLSENYSTASHEYRSGFDRVQTVLQSTETVAERHLSVAQQQLSALQSQAGLLQGIIDAVGNITITIPGSNGGGGVPNPNADFGANPSLNAALAAATGYAGDFGQGGFSAFVAANPGVTSTVNSILAAHGSAGRFRDGGMIPGYANGGLIGNGMWDVDSVIARYAGGGTIALAGGEYVMPAPATREYLPALEAMRAGTFRGPASDMRGVEVRLDRLASAVERLIGLEARAGEGVWQRLDRVADAAEASADAAHRQQARAA